MTMITRIDPFRELASFFENFSGPTGKDQLTSGSFVPPVDVYEDEHNLILKLEVPGVNERERRRPERERRKRHSDGPGRAQI